MAGITPINRGEDQQSSADLADRARQVRAEYDRQKIGITGDPALHPVGRQIKLAQAYTRAAGQLRELEAVHDRARLFRVAAGHTAAWQPEDAMSGRNARDRAEQIVSADDAARQINAASAAGDADLVKAIAHHAVKKAAERPESDWTATAGDYLEKSGVASSVRHIVATQHGAQAAVEKGIYWLPVPDEFGRMQDFEVFSLAKRDVGAAVAAATAPQRAAWDSANRRSGHAA